MKQLFPLLLVFFLPLSSARACLKWHAPSERGCDTLVFQDGRRVAAYIEKITREEIVYSPCADAEERSFVVDRTQVAEVKRFKMPPGPAVIAAATRQKEPLEESIVFQRVEPEPDAEWLVDSSVILGIISIVLLSTVIGALASPILGLISISRASKALRLLKKLPGKRRLIRRAKLAIFLSALAIAGFIALLVTFFSMLSSLNGLNIFPHP